GASNLIVSLWRVNDYATSEIMKNLYDHLGQGIRKDEALKQAKLTYIQSVNESVLAHPAFWSPFITIGNTQPVSIREKGLDLRWVFGGILAVLVLGMGVMFRRRM
ncbi:MAG: CHAT domain-containing protein, partial [Bacteroidetes bacterium]|nr:CHAT domain-containing protein [Bacteroidota bacterium]